MSNSHLANYFWKDVKSSVANETPSSEEVESEGSEDDFVEAPKKKSKRRIEGINDDLNSTIIFMHVDDDSSDSVRETINYMDFIDSQEDEDSEEV
jgi:hypothetical protein